MSGPGDTPVRAEGMFPVQQREEYEEHGYRYIDITEATKQKDVKTADTQNRRMYEARLESQRQSGLLGARVSGDGAPAAGADPPSRPSNAERYLQWQECHKKVDAVVLAVAVHNLAARGLVLFADYTPVNAVACWSQLDRSLKGVHTPPWVRRTLPIAIPGPASLPTAGPATVLRASPLSASAPPLGPSPPYVQRLNAGVDPLVGTWEGFRPDEPC
jgi:hypothetical protein